MTAQPPSRLGPYEVASLLGEGGMGEVYRARDPRLKRDVAIKVLARAGTDPAQHQRLLGEAQAASALNHPNIVTVYDVGAEGGVPYIVSELVEGMSLRSLVSRAPLPIREVLDLAAQMADGLAAAHEAGIVHRDLKPENVIVTRDGRVKILDFGLALVGRPNTTADVKTVSQDLMLLVGTVPYMSPEQARGAPVDFRTDQFSLGLTLYELVTGQRAFRAETAAQVLAAILDDDAEPIAKINPKVPAPVRWVVERCLAKDARQRYDATADLARELRTLRDRVAEFAPPADVAPEALRRRRAKFVIGALAATAAIGLLVRYSSGAGGIRLDQYRWTPFETGAGYQGSPAWSRDGKTLAYVAEIDGVRQVFAKRIDASKGQQVTHGIFHCRDPFWSQDGTRLYYTAPARDGDGLYSISASGGEPEPVMEDVYRATLSPDEKTLAFFRGKSDSSLQLWLSSAPGFAPSPYTRAPFASKQYIRATMHFSPDGSKLGVWVERAVEQHSAADTMRAEFWVIPIGEDAPYMVATPVSNLAGLAPAFGWLPDSRRVLGALPDPSPGTHLWLIDTRGAAPRLLTTSGGLEDEPAISPDGRVALTLQQQDYDLYQLSLEHPSRPEAVLATSRNEMDPAVGSPAGVMAYTTDRTGRGEIWLRSEQGHRDDPLVTPADFGASQTYLLSAPAISNDGDHIAYSRAGPEGYRIWITPRVGGPPIQLTTGLTLTGLTLAEESPSWSPKDDWIAFAQQVDLAGHWSLAKMHVGDRTKSVELAPDIVPFSPVQWSPDGAWIAYNGQKGLSIVSPDGQSPLVLHDDSWLAFAWSDSHRLYGIRLSNDEKHLTFTSVDIRSRAEHVIGPDFMPLPVSGQPVRGFTLLSPTTFLTSIVHVRSDVWLLDGFQPSPTLWDRLVSLVSFGKR